MRIFWERYGHGRADDPLHADVGARPLPLLEDADSVLRAPVARRDLRPARQRALRQASGRSRLSSGSAVAETRRRCSTLLGSSGQWSSLRCDMGEALILAAEHPERVSGVVFIAPGPPGGRSRRSRQFPFDEELDTDEGWAKENRHYWLRDWRGYVEFFISKDVHGAALDEADRGLRRLGARDGCRDPARQLSRLGHEGARPGDDASSSVRRVRCPVLVIHGTEDELVEPERARAFASRVGRPLRAPRGLGSRAARP